MTSSSSESTNVLSVFLPPFFFGVLDVLRADDGLARLDFADVDRADAGLRAGFRADDGLRVWSNTARSTNRRHTWKMSWTSHQHHRAVAPYRGWRRACVDLYQQAGGLFIVSAT